MTNLNEQQIRLGIFIFGFIVGAGSSFWYLTRGKKREEKLSILQLGALSLFFGYMVACSVLNQVVSDAVMIGIIGVFGGETFGKVVANVKNDDDKKTS